MKKWIGIAALVSVMGASSALAGIVTEPDPVGGLVMTIDTVNKNFYFEGTDTGNAEGDSESFYQLFFATQNKYEFSVKSQFLLTSVFTGLNNSLMLYENGSDPLQIQLVSYAPPTDITSLTPTTATVSYADMTSADQTVFESMIGDSFTCTSGSGYSNISIQAVPEPATLGLMVVAGGVVYLRRRSKLRDFS